MNKREQRPPRKMVFTPEEWNQCIKDGLRMTPDELLNWARCQLLRAAREIDLLTAVAGTFSTQSPAAAGCDLTAEVIERSMIVRDYRLVNGQLERP